MASAYVRITRHRFKGGKAPTEAMYRRALRTYQRAWTEYFNYLYTFYLSYHITTGMTMASFRYAADTVDIDGQVSTKIATSSITGYERKPHYGIFGNDLGDKRKSSHGLIAGKDAYHFNRGGPRHFRIEFWYTAKVWQLLNLKRYFPEQMWDEAREVLLDYLRDNMLRSINKGIALNIYGETKEFRITK